MRIIFSISTSLAVLSLAVGYTLAGLWPGTIVIIGLGLLALATNRWQWRGWLQMITVAVVSFTGAAVVGTWLGVSPGWLLVGLVAALAAGDVTHFGQRMRQAGQVEPESRLWRTYRQRLLIVAGLGLVLGGVALSLQFNLSFGWGMFLGLVTILGLSRVIGVLRRESD